MLLYFGITGDAGISVVLVSFESTGLLVSEH